MKYIVRPVNDRINMRRGNNFDNAIIEAKVMASEWPLNTIEVVQRVDEIPVAYVYSTSYDEVDAVVFVPVSEEHVGNVPTMEQAEQLVADFERAVDGAGKADGQRYFIITLDTHRGSKAHVENVLMAVNEGDDPASLIHSYGCEYYEDGEYDEDEGVLVCVDEYSKFIVGWNYQEITRAEYDVMVKYISRAWGYTAEVK